MKHHIVFAWLRFVVGSILITFLTTTISFAADDLSADSVKLKPQIVGKWWEVAGSPDLGEWTSDRQQPVDFAIWQARDGRWQLWSCIRHTNCGGYTRLLFGWEGSDITDTDWESQHIKWQADPSLGEKPGGMQAPFVFLRDGVYHLFYGCKYYICRATGENGKSCFERVIQPSGITGMFNETPENPTRANSRDPMVLRLVDTYYCYYTANPNGEPQAEAVYCRTSRDLNNWSDSTIVFRGRRLSHKPMAECPYVVDYRGWFYLFLSTTTDYSEPLTTVYRSHDPLAFDDSAIVAELPVAAAEIIRDGENWYIAALNAKLDGIRIAKLQWEEASAPPRKAD